jgi:hypothetical protein
MIMSIKTTARLGGLLYLINIIFGFFAIGYIPGVVVSEDPYITAQNILTHEHLYRLGLSAHVVILLTNIPLGVIFYRIFKPVNKFVTLLVIFFTLVGTAVETCNLLTQFVPLILTNAQFTVDFTKEQLASLAFMFHRLQNAGVNLAFAFFGFYGICIGYLIAKSAFLPKIIGALMAIGGTCYVFNSFASFLSPPFATQLFPYIQVPSGLAELTLCLWFLIAGLNVRRWQDKNMKTKEVYIASV